LSHRQYWLLHLSPVKYLLRIGPVPVDSCLVLHIAALAVVDRILRERASPSGMPTTGYAHVDAEEGAKRASEMIDDAEEYSAVPNEYVDGDTTHRHGTQYIRLISLESVFDCPHRNDKPKEYPECQGMRYPTVG